MSVRAALHGRCSASRFAVAPAFEPTAAVEHCSFHLHAGDADRATAACRKKPGEEGKIDRASWQARLLRRRDHLMRLHEARPDGTVRYISPCCPKKPSITIPVKVGAKFHQELEFGLPEHQKRCAILRNTNEGTNGTAKDGATVGLEQPTRRRKRGIAAQSLSCAALLFGENLRRIESFLKKASEDEKGELVSGAGAAAPQGSGGLPPRRWPAC